MSLTILPLVTGSSQATCTICDQKAERALVTDESLPVIETLCRACARSVIAFESLGKVGWYSIADAIRSEMAPAE